MVNLTPLLPAPAVRPWLSLEITRESNFIQAIATTAQKSTLNVGQVVDLEIPFCKKLIVQSVNRDRVTLGCWLAIYLNASPKEPEKKLPRQLGVALKAMLVARGIPLGEILIDSVETIGAIPRNGSDPVEVADALGYVLYCDAELKVRITPKTPRDNTLGEFDLAELATYQPGDGGPLPANRIIVKGELVRTQALRDNEESIVRERVATGWRTIITSSQVRGRNHILTETIQEPPSEISRFSASFEKTTDPNALIARFTEPLEESAMLSQTTITITTRDYDGYIKKRVRNITGCAAKGISSFYSAWAGASMPKPSQSTIEPSGTPDPPSGGGGPREYTIVGASGDQINSSASNTPTFEGGGSTAQPITLLKPSGMFNVIPLLIEVETWDYGRDLVTYERKQQIPLGAILPEIGNPLAGYQEPTDLSPPVYRDPTPLLTAEHEIVKWVKDDLDRWESRRTLSQAIGIRNAQEPRDAMGAVQFTEEDPNRYTQDRSNVALAVATQLKVATSSQQYSTPPGASPIDEMQEVETYTPYSELIELNGTDLLDRTLEINPSPFCPDLATIRKVAEYAALELRGQANTIRIGLPLSILPYDIPPNSAIKLEGKVYLAPKVSANVGSAESVFYLDLWEL